MKILKSKNLALLPVVILAAFLVLNLVFGLSESIVFDPPYLYFALNVIFWSGAIIAIAFVSATSFLRDGSRTVLLISSSVLILGLSLIVGGLVLPFSVNSAVAIGGICYFAAALLQVVSSFLSLAGKDKAYVTNRKVTFLAVFLGSLLFIGLFSILALSGLLPPFYTATGPTLLRQVFVVSNAFFFALSSLIFGFTYIRSSSPVIFWYAIAVGLIALGALSALATTTIGDIPTWVTRVSFYVGTFYFIFAVVKSRGSVYLDLSSKWTEAFRSEPQQLATLFSKMLNGFSYHQIVIDKNGRPFDYLFLAVNDAFEKMTGLKRENVIGKRATEVLPGIEKDSVDWIGVFGKVALTGQSLTFENYSETLTKWYSVSAYSPRKGYFAAIFEDITERRKANREVMSLAKFPLENPAAVLRVDQKGTVMFSNPPGEGFLKGWQTKVGGEVPEHIRQTVIKALESAKRIEFEENVGEEIFAFLAVPILAEGYVNLYGRSITKRKKAEESLRMSEEKYRLLVESPSSIIMTADKDLNITYMNGFGLSFFGYTAEELVGRNVVGTTIPLTDDEGRDLSEMAKDMIKNPEVYRTNVHKNMRKDGTLVWVSWTNSFRYDQQGNVIEVIAVGNDISKQKEAEDTLRESKIWEVTSLYTRNLIEVSLDPLVTINAEGKITDVNRATVLVTGCSREELIGSDFSSYFTEPEKAAAGYKQVFTQGFVTDYPLAIRHKSGKVTEVLYNASVYRNAAGQVQGVFAAARDITDRKKLEEKLHETERLATIGATAGMVGHDIRNPLQAIAGDVYLLESEVASLPQGEAKQNMKESLEGIDQNVQYVNKIVQDLQDYTRQINPHMEETDLEALCENVLFSNGVPENIDASCRVEEKVKKIATDSALLKRILSNLLINAFQAMPNGGKIILHAYRDAGDTVMTIQDTGVGIPDEIMPKLFHPLFTTKSKGQGFGLAVVKRLTDILGGSVTCESKVGKGTKFTVRLPLPKSK